MSIVTAADVETALHRSLTDEEIADVAAMVPLYQEQVEQYLGRSVEQREFTETVTVPYGRRWVPQHGPIVSVSSVMVDGVAQVATNYTVRRDWIEVGAVAYPTSSVEVTYVGGWDAQRALPAKHAVLSRVLRTLGRATSDLAAGVKSESIEAEGIRHTVTMEDAGVGATAGFTADEVGGLGRLKRRVYV